MCGYEKTSVICNRICFSRILVGLLRKFCTGSCLSGKKRTGVDDLIFDARVVSIEPLNARAIIAEATGAKAAGAAALGALAIGGLAIGFLAIGRLIIREMLIKQVHLSQLKIDQLDVADLRVKKLTVQEEHRSEVGSDNPPDGQA